MQKVLDQNKEVRGKAMQMISKMWKNIEKLNESNEKDELLDQIVSLQEIIAKIIETETQTETDFQ